MQVQVKLPVGLAIEVFDLCSAIAQAVWPTEGLKGIDCIDGGFIRASSIAEGNAVLEPSASALPTEMDAGPEVSRFPRATAEGWMAKHWLAAPPIDAGLADVELPIALTEDDRRWLEGVLRHLPSLRYPISDGVRAAFLSAYRNLKERRAWEPCLLTEKDVLRHKLKQDAVFVDHRNALERMFETGTLSLFNRRHAPASGFSVRGLISRPAAIAYLEQHGFVCRDPESEKTPDQPGQSDAEWRPGQRKISLEREQEVFIYYMGQKAANVRGPRKATAEHYGVTRKTIYNICERVEERRKNGRLD